MACLWLQYFAVSAFDVHRTRLAKLFGCYYPDWTRHNDCALQRVQSLLNLLLHLTLGRKCFDFSIWIEMVLQSVRYELCAYDGAEHFSLVAAAELQCGPVLQHNVLHKLDIL